MSTLAVTNTFSNGATVQASEHNTNYSDIVSYINNRNSASSTWDACSVLSASSVPLIADNSSGTSDIVQFKDNGTTVFQVLDGGYVTTVNQSAARAFRATSNQTFTDNASTKVQFNSETFDVKGEFDSTTNFRFTATVAGKYIVTSGLQITTGASATISDISIFKNGSVFSTRRFNVQGSTTESIAMSDILSLAATDFVEIFGNFNSTATNTTVNFGSDLSWVSIHKIA